jgi:alkylation response protein AidB-like acyl-CoA dehydrogenase
VTNGGEADVYLTMAVTGERDGRREITSFLVEGASVGLTVSSIEHKMGQRAAQTSEMNFSDVKVR